MKKSLSLLLVCVLSLLVSCSSGIKSESVDKYIKDVLELENDKLQCDAYFELYGISGEEEIRSSIAGVDFTKPEKILEVSFCDYSPLFDSDYSSLPESIRESMGNMGNSVASYWNTRKSISYVAFSSALTSSVTFACDTQDKAVNYIYVYKNVDLFVSVSKVKNNAVTVSVSPLFADEDEIDQLLEMFDGKIAK